jgi:uncharacterized membrane protein
MREWFKNYIQASLGLEYPLCVLAINQYKKKVGMLMMDAGLLVGHMSASAFHRTICFLSSALSLSLSLFFLFLPY